MAEAIYNRYKKALADADEDWVAGDYRVLLLTGSATFNKDSATLTAALAGNTEASDGSYGRVTLAGKTVTQNNTDNRGELDANTADFGALNNETPTAMIVYRHVDGTNGNDLPVSFHDTNFGVAANGAGYTVEFPNDVIRIT